MSLADRALLGRLVREPDLSWSELRAAIERVEGGAMDLGRALLESGAISEPQLALWMGSASVTRADDPEDGSALGYAETQGDRPVSSPGFDEPDTYYDLAEPDLGAARGSAGHAAALGPTAPSPAARLATLEDRTDRDPPARLPTPALVDDDEDDGFSPTRPAQTAYSSDPPSVTSNPWNTETEMPWSDRIDSGIDVSLRVQSGPVSPTGRTTQERYQLLGELGRGGMGRVLKGQDRDIGREVAVKILLRHREHENLMVRRFWTEVQATGQLEHPSIIPIHDVGRLPSGELFYVMKRLTGRTLASILRSLSKGEADALESYSRARLLTIFQQIAYAVAFAHARNVIHRDIKPGNIMVGRYGEAILIDWGLAKVVEGDHEIDELPIVKLSSDSAAETQSGTITGTPQYMSPEATEGHPSRITAKSDVYSLGAVLYELLTHEPAFPDIGFVPTVMKVREGDFVPPRRRQPRFDIPEELDELCQSAMAKDPDIRPSAKELADDVGRILEGARERERRVLRAKERLREGRQAADRWKLLKMELQQSESESKRLAKEIPPWAEPDQKAKIWTVEDRVVELKVEAISAFEEAEAAFLRGLGEVPEDRETRNALASLYFARFGEAERARDSESQRYYRRLVSRYDDGAWSKLLEGTGSLALDVRDAGPVELELARLESRLRTLQPAGWRKLGRPPVAEFELAHGSYVVVAHRPGAREMRIPVYVGRTEAVRISVDLPADEDLGDDFIWVPGGPAILGGDPVAHGSLDRQRVDLPDFAIARFPVTCGEYLAFLNDWVQRDLEAALQHVPRARAHEGHYWTLDRETGRFEFPETTPGGHAWTAELPVNGVSYRDALAFIAWRSERTGERLRLPTEQEWEKAARGPDGRFFPWGDEFDATFCKMKESRPSQYPEPEPVGTFLTDCSVYGARDMAGGIRELCATQSEGRTVPVMRGGCWHDTGLFCRVAFRHLTQPDFVNTGLGFRLAKDLG